MCSSFLFFFCVNVSYRRYFSRCLELYVAISPFQYDDIKIITLENSHHQPMTQQLYVCSMHSLNVVVVVDCIVCTSTQKLFAHSHKCKNAQKVFFRLTIPTHRRRCFSHHFSTHSQQKLRKARACNAFEGGSLSLHPSIEWCLYKKHTLMDDVAVVVVVGDGKMCIVIVALSHLRCVSIR